MDRKAAFALETRTVLRDWLNPLEYPSSASLLELPKPKGFTGLHFFQFKGSRIFMLVLEL